MQQEIKAEVRSRFRKGKVDADASMLDEAQSWTLKQLTEELYPSFCKAEGTKATALNLDGTECEG